MIENAIVYKYNKYIQVNGTLFYAFDYLLKSLEALDLLNISDKPNKKELNLNLYIIIPTKLKKGYLQKLQHMFRTRYPLWFKKFFKDEKLFETLKILYPKDSPSYEEYIDIQHKIRITNEAFSRIKLVTPYEFIKKTFNNVMIPCYNTWSDLNRDGLINENIKNLIVFQNRKIQDPTLGGNLDFKFANQNKTPTIFLYELEPQNPEKFLDDNHKCEEYKLKIAFDYIPPKNLMSKFPKSEMIIAGEPIVNTKEYLIGVGKYKKPSLFANLPKISYLQLTGIQEPTFFLNTKRLDYNQNFLRFEENTRLIPEARYLNIPIKITQTLDKNIDNLSTYNYLNQKDLKIEDLPEDSSVSRLQNDLNLYKLETNDKVIKFLIET